MRVAPLLNAMKTSELNLEALSLAGRQKDGFVIRGYAQFSDSNILSCTAGAGANYFVNLSATLRPEAFRLRTTNWSGRL